MFNDYPYEIESRCIHRHIKLVTKGKVYFSAGEIWDDIVDQFFCFDCGKSLSEVEIRACWNGRNMSFTNSGSERRHGRR